MLRRGCYVLFLAALSAVAIATPAIARLQPAVGQPQLSGSARLTGRVIAADNGRPVRRASVSLSGLPDSQQKAGPNREYVSRKVETDVNGRFDFADLPAGSYRINVDPVSGFVRLALSKEATLTEGQTAEMTVRLERSGAIEGRIQDENGDGMLGAQVQAVRRLDVGGHTTLRTWGASAATDDRGAFRLFNLPAGDYYVMATYTRLPWRNEPAAQSGYADTYYPGSPALRGAQVVVVRGGRDSTRVNVTLAPCRLARLSISPVDSSGVPLGREAQVTLTKRDDVYLPFSTRQTSRREDGTFLFDGIQPGDYYLIVTTSAQMEEAAYVNVSIHEADVSLNVHTNTGARVSGRIIVDGKPAGDGGSRSATVLVSSNPPLRKYGPTYARVPLARVRGTDRFELAGLRGPMELFAEVAGGALLSIQRRGEEIAGKTLEFAGTEAIDDVVVTLTTQVAQVDVTVTNASSRGEAEPVLVVLFSDDPKRWHQGFIQYARTSASRLPAGSGALPSVRTRLIRMPPGQYLIAAIHDDEISYPTELGVLEKLRPLATPVTLVAGQTANVTLGVVKPAR
jgi:hypothetical protein